MEAKEHFMLDCAESVSRDHWIHERQPHILVVDDDARLRSLLARYFSKQGWLVTCAHSAEDARLKLTYFIVDLIVLDVMMPMESGISFAETYKKSHATPIFMLTAMGEVDDRIIGLEAGADDYLAKPFEPKELLIRAKKLLQRTMKPEAKPTLRFGAYSYDMTARLLTCDGETVPLTENETTLLHALAEHCNQATSRDDLAAYFDKSDEDAAPSRHIDVLVTRLRKKIEAEPSRPMIICTVRGEGYMLRAEP
jgi:two-component system, OmpR family, phosphate regulon response regulator OmpR